MIQRKLLELHVEISFQFIYILFQAYMSAMQTQWTWLLQLTSCLETHLKHATRYHKVNWDRD